MIVEFTNENSFDILKMLFEETHTKKDILEKLSIKNPTFYKHIQILKKAGFDIIKKNNIYFVRTYKNLVKIAEYEKSLLAYLGFLSFYMLPHSKLSLFIDSMDKMLRFCTKKDYKETFDNLELYKIATIEKDYRDKIDAIQKYIDLNAAIKVTLLSKKELLLTPVAFLWQKEKVYLHYIDSVEMKKGTVLLENIVKITSQDGIDLDNYAKETIFELYGKLSKSYLLKDEERIIDSFKDRIVVANASNDKNTLFKRLLRYDVFCKILFPKTDVVEFQNLIKKSLDNIK